MAIRMWRLAEDEFLDSPDAPGSKQQWYIDGTEDETEIPGPIDANIPNSDDFGNPRIDATAKHLGGGTWLVTARFGPIPPLATGLTLWDVDTTGGREKRYQSIDTTFQVAATGFAVTNTNGAIGVTETGVEGVDVPVPKIALKAKRKFKTTDLPSDYLDTIEQLTGRVNEETFTVVYWGQVYTFEPGELMLLGAHVSIATETELEIDCAFEGSRDRLTSDGNGISLEGFPAPIDKRGWEYLWIIYQNATANNQRVKKPIQVNCEQVADPGDFSALLL